MLPIIKHDDQSWFPNLFNDFFSEAWPMFRTSTAPAINVVEDEEHYQIDVAAPGMTKDDFSIYLNDQNALIITMRKQEEKDDQCKECKYLRHEFNYSSFEQQLLLPKNIDKDSIHAKIKHGILQITMNKIVPEALKQENKVIDIQ